METYLDFDDVLILPEYSELNSRSEVDPTNQESFMGTSIPYKGTPIIVSNMATTGTFEVAKVAQDFRFLTAIHKFYTYDDWIQVAEYLNPEYLIYTIGAREELLESELQRFEQVCKLFYKPIPYLMIDAANGYSKGFLDAIFRAHRVLEDKGTTIIAGNVVTKDGVSSIYESGGDVVKVGIGPGHMCTTRVQTGVGMPQFSAIRETYGLTNIISDGGIKNSGDIAKAFVAGADMVMIGSMFAGFHESGGDMVQVDGKWYKTHYGMSSKTAQRTHYGNVADYRSSEGRSVLVPYKGEIKYVFSEIVNNLRSTMTYIGKKNIRDFRDAKWIRVNRTHEKHYERLDTEERFW